MAHAIVSPTSRTTDGFYRLCAAAAVAMALALVILTGIVGFGRGGAMFADNMHYLYVAGEMWENSLSPYVSKDFITSMKTIADMPSINYGYPPTSAPVALLLSFGTIGYANVLITTLNFAALGAMIFYVLRANAVSSGSATISGASIQDPVVLLAIAVVIGNPFASHVFWMGQTTLVSAALLLTAWLSAHKGHDIAAGILLALAAYKPQLAVLVGLWFLLDRRWMLLFTAAGTTVLLSAWPIVATGIEGSWLGWLSAVTEYEGAAYNVAEFRNVFGVRSLFATMGWDVPSLLLLGVAATILLYIWRGHYQEIWLVGPILAISMLLVYSHDYDAAALSIMALPLFIACRKRPAALIALGVFAFVLYVPQRFFWELQLGALTRSREIALLGILALYAVMCRRHAVVPVRALAVAA